MNPEPGLNLLGPPANAAQRPTANGQRPTANGSGFLAFVHRLIPIFVGLVLIGAAFLKGHQLWTEPMFEPTLIQSQGFQIALLIELELAIGLGLVGNFWPGLLRKIAIVLFAAFTGVALSKGVAGARSCGCAGNFEVAPWMAVIVDLAIMTALWRWRPKARPGFIWFQGGLAIAFLSVLPWPLLAAFRPAPYPRLMATPVIDLGKLFPGERRAFTLLLQNPHAKPVEIAVLESSCPCLEARDLPCRLGPGGQNNMDLVLDLSPDPEFTGPLLIKVTAKTGKGTIGFVTQVSTVRR